MSVTSYIPDDRPREISQLKLYKCSDPSLRLGGYTDYFESINKSADPHTIKLLMQSKKTSEKPYNVSFNTIMNSKKMSYSDLLKQLGLPSVTSLSPTKHIIISDNNKCSPDNNILINDILNKLNYDDSTLFRKCLSYYNGMYPKKSIYNDLSNHKNDLGELLHTMFTLSDIDSKQLLVLL